MNKPLLAIITPVFRNYKMLEEAMNSVLDQTVGEQVAYELALVDDGSNDNDKCWNKIKDFEFRIKRERANFTVVTYQRKRNDGPSMARNIGVMITSAPWICYLDNDDLCDRDRVKHTIRHIYDYANEQTDLIFFNYQTQLGGTLDPHPAVRSPELYIQEFDSIKIAAKDNLISDSLGIVHSRTLFDRMGGWPPYLLGGEDGVFCRRLIEASRKIDFSQKIAGLKRILNHGQGITERRFDSGLYIKLDREHEDGATGQYLDHRQLKDFFIDSSQDTEFPKRYELGYTNTLYNPYENYRSNQESDNDSEDFTDKKSD